MGLWMYPSRDANVHSKGFKGAQNYQHPEYIQKPQRYQARFDFYSLRVVLLEIAHWQLLDRLTRGKGWQTLRDEEFRLGLVKDARSNSLAHKVGARYCQAIKSCLAARANSPDETRNISDDASWAQQYLQLHVVDVLATCSGYY
ncbi:hypothetical protein B0J11DRAFT_512429 [Dendryphion nanum]|uniref:Protein kinase domain-containing protein n=1 Tax=Dendryphion nanum TaxID=256645 RepID=A0A9P9I861_9PLEO|nr:hypothetical protein B0J11DRAFT_512429 [Dendryphion nanum]